jgi:hypothetical protein
MNSPHLAYVLLLLTVGCAIQRLTPLSTPGEAGVAQASLSGPSSVIARAELGTVRGQTAVQAIKHLRPQFLAGTQPAPLRGERVYPSVYIENRPFAGLETLSGVPVDALDEVRFLKPSEARNVYGPGCACAAGVIVLRMRRDPAGFGPPRSP